MIAQARITKDRIADGPHNRKGERFSVGETRELRGNDDYPRHSFSLVDDDGITYYEGWMRGDEEGLATMEENLWQWGAWDAGTTLLRVDGEDVIG
jgi:hypothetical protein